MTPQHFEFNGIRLFESPHAVDRKPARQHEKKRWMTDAYHSRIQKKWNKRYGYILKPACYVVSNRVLVGMGGDGKTMIAHPDIAAQIKEHAERQFAKIIVGTDPAKPGEDLTVERAFANWKP